MLYQSRSVRRNLGLGSLLVVAGLWLVPASPAAADYPYGSTGEVARIGRQLNDFHYRGRHGDRSPHYSNSGIRFNGRPYRPQPYRPYRPHRPSYGYGYPGVVGCATPQLRPIYIVQQAPAPRPVTREDIEMVPIRVAPREPTQKAIIERVTLADGTVRTVIKSVPIAESRKTAVPENAVAEKSATDPSDGS